MAKQRMVNTKFWDDNYIIDLDPIEKLLFLYFLTNSLTNIAGIYEISIRKIAFDTGIDKDMVKKILDRFKTDKKIYYIEGWIIIANFPKYQSYKNHPKIKRGIELILEEIPDNIRYSMYRLSIPYTYPFNYSNSNSNTNTNTNTNKKALKKIPNKLFNEKHLELAEYLYKLIKKDNPAWYVKPNWNEWADDIRKLNMIDKRTIEQIKWMIDWVQNNDFWKKNILSPGKLRKQFNKLVVEAKYEQNKNKREGVVKI